MTTDLKGRFNQVWIAVGLVIAIGAFGLMYYFTRSTTTPPPAPPSNGQLVVVARTAIPSGSLITPGMLEQTRIKGVLPGDAFTACSQLVSSACTTANGVTAPASSATGTTSDYYAVVAIAPNTVITQNLVSLNKATQAPSFGNLNLPAGDVAEAINITSQEAVAGYLQVGDRIDIIATDNSGNTGFTYEDLPVIAVGAPSTQGAASSSASGGEIVLELTRSQALGVSELVHSGDIFNIVLRSSADYGHGYVPVTASPQDEYTQACVPGTKVNPAIEEDLQNAQQAVKTATTTYNQAQKQLNKDNTALQALQSGSSAEQAAKAQVLTDSANLAQDEFALVEAQNEVASDQAVLYCGATSASAQSNASGNGQGSFQMLQNLFGFNLAG